MALKDFALGGSTLVSEKDTPKFVLLQRTIDFGVSANSVVSGDTCTAINIPAGFFCNGTALEVQTVEATTSAQATKVSVGDGADADGWLATVTTDLSTIQTYITTSTVAYGITENGNGKFYSTADTIDIFPQGTLNAAKIRLAAWGFMLKPGNDTAFGLDGDSA